MKNIAILASHNGSGLDAIYEAVQNGILECSIVLVISNNTNAVALQKADNYGLRSFLVNAATVKTQMKHFIQFYKQTTVSTSFSADI